MEKCEIYRQRLLSVLASRKWDWLSPSERNWLQELWDEDSEDEAFYSDPSFSNVFGPERYEM